MHRCNGKDDRFKAPESFSGFDLQPVLLHSSYRVPSCPVVSVRALRASRDCCPSRAALQRRRHPAEILATITVRLRSSARGSVRGARRWCSTVTLDGNYVQHLPVVRTGRAEYRLLLGAVDAGRAHACGSKRTTG